MKENRNIIFTETDEGAIAYDLMPPYSSIGIQYLYNNLFMNQGQIIADIGSGTGRLTSQILRDNIVYGIEPDEKMRMVAEHKFKDKKNFHSLEGTAENIPLTENSIDFITVGQAFHRFDIEQFRTEADRILKKKDNIIIIWNRIDYSNPVFKDLLLALKQSYSNYHSRFTCLNEVEGAKLETEENNKMVSKLYHRKSKLITFENQFVLSEEKFTTLCLSLWIFPLSNGHTAQSIIHSDEFNLPEFNIALKNIYNSYQINGKIVLPLKTDIHFCN